MREHREDRRSELEVEPFSYRASKDGVVFAEFHGRVSRSGFTVGW
jgi:hypothetical protein